MLAHKLDLEEFVFILPSYLPQQKGKDDLRFWYSKDYQNIDQHQSIYAEEDDEAAFSVLKRSIIVRLIYIT